MFYWLQNRGAGYNNFALLGFIVSKFFYLLGALYFFCFIDYLKIFDTTLCGIKINKTLDILHNVVYNIRVNRKHKTNWTLET